MTHSEVFELHTASIQFISVAVTREDFENYRAKTIGVMEEYVELVKAHPHLDNKPIRRLKATVEGLPSFLQPAFIEFQRCNEGKFRKRGMINKTNLRIEFLRTCDTIIPLRFINDFVKPIAVKRTMDIDGELVAKVESYAEWMENGMNAKIVQLATNWNFVLIPLDKDGKVTTLDPATIEIKKESAFPILLYYIQCTPESIKVRERLFKK